MTTTTMQAPTGRVALADRRIDLRQRLTIPRSIALADGGGSDPARATIRGTACLYNVPVPRGYGLFLELLPGCFAAQVRDPARVKVLWQHDSDEPIGRLSALADDAERLRFEGWITRSEDVPTGRKAASLLADGVVDEVSVGFVIQRYIRVVDEDADTVTYRVPRGQFDELSPVTFGAFGQDATVEEIAFQSAADPAVAGLAAAESRRIRAELMRLAS